jgi:uncharacterized OB-fold protein
MYSKRGLFMKCKNCNNEVTSEQEICQACNSKIEKEIKLSDVDKTTITDNGVVVYDFDFSDQIKSNRPKNIEKKEVIALQETNDNVDIVTEQVDQNINQETIPVNIVTEEKVINNEIISTENINNDDVKQENNSVQNNKQYTVLGRDDRHNSHIPVIIISILAVLFGGIYFIYNTFIYETESKPNIQNNNETNNEKNEDVIDKLEEEPSLESTGSLTVPTTDISYSNLTLKIPNTLLYQYENDMLVLYPQNQEWAAAFGVSDGNYSSLKTNKEQLANELVKAGMNVKSYGIKYFGGVEWLSYETELSKTNILVVYLSVKTNKYGAFTIQNKTNTFDYDILRTLAPVVQSIK